MFRFVTISKRPVLKRFWLHLGEFVAAKNSNRWPALAAECDLDAFGSFTDTDSGKTVFSYDGVIVGETTTNDGKHRDNTLSPFMDSMRMIVAAYDRSIVLGDLVRKGESPHCQPIVLDALQLRMLFAHPQYDALQASQEADGIIVGLRLSESTDDLHQFFAGELHATA